MNKRIIKKTARRYLNSGKTYRPYGVEYDQYGEIVKKMAIFPARISREIQRLAERQGWDGCHWDDPLLLELNGGY